MGNESDALMNEVPVPSCRFLTFGKPKSELSEIGQDEELDVQVPTRNLYL